MDKKTHPRKYNKHWIAAASIICLVVAAALYWPRPTTPARPQEPKGPFPYQIANVTFKNEIANINLSGTLTIPNGSRERYPVVVLISGSGPQNRDGEWLGHKPFQVIADHLTRNDLAVLRFDDRGFGESGGVFHTSTSYDFSTDVESAIHFLKERPEIDSLKIGLIGHSDGGMIAPMVAARSKDVSFIVLLGAPGIHGGQLFIERQILDAEKTGKTKEEIACMQLYLEGLVDIISSAETEAEVVTNLKNFAQRTYHLLPDSQVPAGMTKDEFISRQIQMLSSPWFKYFFTYDPASTLQGVRCPVLALAGSKDVQAPAELNLPSIKEALVAGGNTNITIKKIENLNHMFQECQTGRIEEYSQIEQTFAPIALEEMLLWIQKVI